MRRILYLLILTVHAKKKSILQTKEKLQLSKKLLMDVLVWELRILLLQRHINNKKDYVIFIYTME